MLNPLNIVFALVGRFVQWTAPKPRPLPDPDGRQGLQRVQAQRWASVVHDGLAPAAGAAWRLDSRLIGSMNGRTWWVKNVSVDVFRL
jgi:hypothetical protein